MDRLSGVGIYLLCLDIFPASNDVREGSDLGLTPDVGLSVKGSL